MQRKWSRYLRTVIGGLIATTLIGAIFGYPLYGLLAGLLNLVPYVGPIVSTCIGLLLALTSHYGGDADMHIGTLVGLIQLLAHLDLILQYQLYTPLMN